MAKFPTISKQNEKPGFKKPEFFKGQNFGKTFQKTSGGPVGFNPAQFKAQHKG